MFKPVQFGKYYLTERIAVGGMAEIFKAKLFGVDGFEKSMVVKQILPQYSRNAEFIQMFIDEAKIAVTLTHGNIVPVYELGRLGDTYFIAMEYVQGKDLAEILEVARNRNKSISPEHAAFIAIEICKGLDYAHRRTNPQGRPLGFVHRDISPPNILISLEGEVKITDFGIAKAAHKLGTTEAGVVKGTYGYMSPEQVRGLPVDHRTDIFSTGILLHEMLTGRRLFTGRNDLEAIERVKEAQIPAPSAVGAWVPSSIDPIVFRALAKDPADRYSSANELQLALSRFLFTGGQGATSATLSHYMSELFGDEASRKNSQEEEILFSALEHHVPPHAMVPPGDAAGGVDNMTQSYAVRPELEEATAISAHPAPQLMDGPAMSRPQATLGAPLATGSRMDVGDGSAQAINATKALPSLMDQGLPHHEFDEEAPTNVFAAAAGPQKPEVPQLRFPSDDKTRDLPTIPGVVSEANAERQALPSAEELASLADVFDEAPRAASKQAPPLREVASRPDVEIRPLPMEKETVQSLAPIDKLDTTPDGDELMSAMAGVDTPPSFDDAPPPGDVPPLVDAPPPGDEVRPGEIHVVSKKKPRPVSGVLSGTMRLFVQGLDNEEEYPLQESVPGQEVLDPSGGYSGLSGASRAYEIPRTIKPTVLGWLIIGVIVLGASLFVIYKKTNLFGDKEEGDLDVETLTRDDFNKGDDSKEKGERGTLVLSSRPPGASFLLFEGDTPLTIKGLDPGRTHALRIERDGYRGVYQEVKPEAFKGGKAEIMVSLHPAGPAAAEEVPSVASGPAASKAATLAVKSVPPQAQVWRVVGQGDKVELAGIDKTKRYYLKAVLRGHRPSFVNVTKVDFKGSDTYATTVKLDVDPQATGDGGTAAPAAATVKDAGGGGEGAAKPAPEPGPATKPAPEAKPEARPEARPEAKPTPRSRRPRVRPRTRRPHRPRRRPKKPTQKPRTKGKKLQMPSWAQ